MEGTVRGALTLVQSPLLCGNVDPLLPDLSSFQEKPELLQKISGCYNVSCYIQMKKPTPYAYTLGQTEGAASTPVPPPAAQRNGS